MAPNAHHNGKGGKGLLGMVGSAGAAVAGALGASHLLGVCIFVLYCYK